jgi:magnesium chelatase family protein
MFISVFEISYFEFMVKKEVINLIKENTMLVKTYAAAVHGISATTITVEVNLSQGINFFIVGLPDNAVKESQRRIDAALKNTGFDVKHKKVIINLAPADIRKEGSAYDLPLAMGILAAYELLPVNLLDKYILMGELSLDGTLQKIRGALPMAINAKEKGFKGIIVPAENAKEAAVIKGIEVYGMKNITEVTTYLSGQRTYEPVHVDIEREFYENVNHYDVDFSDVKGQLKVKRALEIAAAGSHNLLMIGPPGSGKTMLAKRLPGILPPLSLEEALETTKIHSVAGKIENNSSLVVQRPFRDPHHTISDIALVGGGVYPQPGEISLAHNGVLFMDELPEFKRNVLEVLRQPLEGRMITISRAKFTIEYPSSFMLIASMNPCPCGFYNHPDRDCICPAGAVQKYLSRISGPLLDRIDIHIEVVPVPFDKMSQYQLAEKSCTIRERVVKARKIQQLRYSGHRNIHCNAQMNSKLMYTYCRPDQGGLAILKTAMEKLSLSARAYDRILKVSRTIADLDESDYIKSFHISEAVNYRNLDREGWGG